MRALARAQAVHKSEHKPVNVVGKVVINRIQDHLTWLACMATHCVSCRRFGTLGKGMARNHIEPCNSARGEGHVSSGTVARRGARDK